MKSVGGKLTTMTIISFGIELKCENEIKASKAAINRAIQTEILKITLI